MTENLSFIDLAVSSPIIIDNCTVSEWGGVYFKLERRRSWNDLVLRETRKILASVVKFSSFESPPLHGRIFIRTYLYCIKNIVPSCTI